MKRAFLLLLCLLPVLGLTSCASAGRQVIAWDSLSLGEYLPEPAYLVGEVYSDGDDYLNVTIARTDKEAFRAYVSACEDMGYTVEKSKSDWDFSAFNAAGYELTVWHSDKEMDISLHAPVELYPLTWPTSELAQLLPVPESALGQVTYESKEYLDVYVGDITPEAYSAYVTACIEAGFDVDYSRGDDYFYADHAAGYDLSVHYEGFGVMRIYLSVIYE